MSKGFKSGITENSVRSFGSTPEVTHFDEDLGNGTYRETCRIVGKSSVAGRC